MNRMTKAEKLFAFDQLLDRESIVDVAAAINVTPGVLRRELMKVIDRPAKKYKAPKTIYPNIGNWLSKNQMPVATFAEKIGYKKNVIYSFLNGNCKPSFETIVNILAVTGMTFEEAFQKDVANAEERHD